MMRPSWLDAMVEQFQHRWETNAQFRAMVSGVAGLVMVVGLCAVLGVSATFANAIGGSFGSGNNSFVSQAGPNAQSTDVAFPMTTLTPWPAPNIPGAAPIPASQTPQPSPTSQPTPTDVPVPTGQPGGGGGGGGGSKNTVTVTGVSPNPFANGSTITVSVQTNTPNTSILIFVTWPNGAQAPMGGQGTTDANGNGSIQLSGTVPGGCPGGKLILWVQASNGASTRPSYGC